MADNLDRIKDVVLQYADIYAKAFSQKAPRSSGRLAASYRGVAKFTADKFSIEVFGEDYGIYQDSGINGTKKQVSPNGRSFFPPGQFKKKFQMIGGSLPIPVRISIHNNGLRPQPFLQDAVDSVTPRFASALEEAGVEDVEDFFESLDKIKVS